MKTVAIIAIVATLGAIFYASLNTTSDADEHFHNFIAQYGRNYASQDEYNMRKEIFNKQLENVQKHNAKGLSWTIGINKFSDWTDQEYSRLLGLKNSAGQNTDLPVFKSNLKKTDKNDASIDYRNTGYVGPVKNQGACGSCWAFSATQAAEAAYFKKYQQEVILSESHVVDCDWFSHGCNGGLQENAFIHWMRFGPIYESNYPYVPEDRKCQEEVDGAGIPADLPELPIAYRVDVGDDLLYEALTFAPVAISIRAENDAFRQYTGGIIDGDACGTYIDHAVLLVGYDSAENYWIVKNSWGPNWGEEGYVRIKRRGGKGICGINQQNSLPIY